MKYFLYVDNPHTDDKEGKEKRKKSREILLQHLILNCEKVFKPPVMREVIQRISQHTNAQKEALEEQERLEPELKKAKDKMEQLLIQVELDKAKREGEDAGKAMAQEMKAVTERKASELGVAERFLAESAGALNDKGVGFVVKIAKEKCSVM